MASENVSLGELIKRNVDFKIKDLEIDDPKDEKTIDRLEQLTPDMMVRIRATPEIGRDRSLTMRVKIDENMTASLLGHPVEGFRKVQPMEDVTKYMPESRRFAEQIVEALNRVLKEKSTQKPKA
jgi:hypothetical protein